MDPVQAPLTHAAITPTLLAAETPSPELTTEEERSYTRYTPFMPMANPVFLTAQEGSYPT